MEKIYSNHTWPASVIIVVYSVAKVLDPTHTEK